MEWFRIHGPPPNKAVVSHGMLFYDVGSRGSHGTPFCGVGFLRLSGHGFNRADRNVLKNSTSLP